MWLAPTPPVTYLDSTDNASLVHRLFQAVITELQDRPLAEVLGLDEGEDN